MEELTAWSTLFTAIFTGGLFATAVVTAIAAFKTLKASREANGQMKQDSLLRTRPYVYAEVVPSLAGTACYDLVVRNTGQSPARDLTIEFSPPPVDPDDIARRVLRDLKVKRDLHPDSPLRTYWRLGASEGEHMTDASGNKAPDVAGLPLKGALTVRYGSDDASRPVYESSYSFDADTAGLWPVPEDGPEPGDMTKVERRFYKALQAAGRHIAELRR